MNFCGKGYFSPPQEIKGLREELSTRLNSSDTMEIIKDKEEQIRGLLEEGETRLCSTFSFIATNRWYNHHTAAFVIHSFRRFSLLAFEI